MSRQQAILAYISEHIKSNGYSPTLREIGEAVKLKSSSSVHRYLKALEKQGFIKRLSRSARAIEIVKIEIEDEATVTIMRRRVAIKVLEITQNGTFKTVLIGDKKYVLDPMG